MNSCVLFLSVLMGLIVGQHGQTTNRPSPPSLSGPCKRCPNTTFPYSYEDPRTSSIIIRGSWAHPAFSRLTPLLVELRDFLFEIVDANAGGQLNFKWHYAYTNWVSAVLSGAYSYPNLCKFAQVINDSVAYEKTREEKLYVDNMNKVSSLIYGTCEQLKVASLKSIGCKGVSELQASKDQCYENGFVFDWEKYWDLYGRLIPCPVKQIFLKLYQSKNFLERAHATILTFSLNKLQAVLFRPDQTAVHTKLSNMFVLSANTSRCCCSRYASNFESQCSLSNQTAVNNVQTAISEFLGENCSTCPPVEITPLVP